MPLIKLNCFHNRYWILFFSLWAALGAGLAHPVIWKGGQSASMLIQTDQRHAMYHYSVSHRRSVGVHTIQFNTETPYVMAQQNWLLKRWNAPGSQGNTYLRTGLGGSSTDSIGHIGLQADWETTQLYTLVRADYFSLDTSLTRLETRVGFAPYEGSFDSLHTWFIVSITDTIQPSNHRVIIMPLFRFFYRNYLVEWGYNFNNHALAQVMIHF